MPILEKRKGQKLITTSTVEKEEQAKLKVSQRKEIIKIVVISMKQKTKKQ